MMAWFYLMMGGSMEIIWAVGMKFSEGFTRPWISLITVVTIILSCYFFAKSMKQIAVGTAYAVFAGFGAAGTAGVGMLFLQEPVSVIKILFILLLIVGIIGLKSVSDHEPETSNF